MHISRQLAIYAVVSALLLLLLYSPLFHSQFVYDDVTLIAQNANLAHWGNTFDYFRTATPFGGDFGGGPSSYYRPVTWLSFGLDHWFYGNAAPGFHFTNLLLHWINGLLAYTLLIRLGCGERVAMGTALLWLSLPINSEAVAWISARSYTLMFCFVLLALHALERYFRSSNWIPLALFYVMAVCAAFSHETGLLLLPLCLCVFVPKYRRPRQWVWVLSAGVFAAIAYLGARSAAGGAQPSAQLNLLQAGEYVRRYLCWLILPLHMSMERSTDTPGGAISLPVLCWLAALAGALAGTAFLARKAPAIAAGLSWMWVSLLPLCGFLMIYQGMAERYLYVPALGACFALLMWLQSGPGGTRQIATLLFCCWTVWSSWRTYARASDWTNEQSLFASSLEATPKSWILWLNLGNAYLQKRELGASETAYQTALQIHPQAVKALDNLATAKLMAGDPQSAEQIYRRAIAVNPARPDAYVDLGVVLFDEGKLPEAEEMLQKAIQLGPRNATAYFNLGVLYANSGKRDQAAAMYRLALTLHPDYPDAEHALQLLDGAKQ